MADSGKPFVITLEEHFWDPDIGARLVERTGNRPRMADMLFDLGSMRLAQMDESGIDMQVISHSPPATQWLNPETAIEMAARANNRLAEAAANNPSRFAGFATLPTPDPQAAAEELERAVTQFGFKGALVAPITHGVFLDDKRFWPIFERAEALDVPIYVHPGQPHEAVFDAYYKTYATEHPSIASAGWGYTVETATTAIRLILSGLFEAYPRLKIILGHMGESVPFSLCRIDEALNRMGNKPVPFRETFCNNFWITTSGNFSTPALMCSILEIGVDRIMFSVDWPYVENQPGMDWMATLPLCAEDKEKLYSGNAKRLLKL